MIVSDSDMVQAAIPETASPRERFAGALDRRPLVGRVPHFELVFFLTMEAFGKVHPSHRSYHQWLQMQESERELHRRDMARLYIDTAERFEHSAIFVHPNPGDVEESIRQLEQVRALDGGRYFTLRHGDATFAIPDGNGMVEFSYRLIDEPHKVHEQAQRMVDSALSSAEAYRRAGVLDGFALCSDYCFNSGPFLSPEQFSEFVTPYLKQLIAGYRALGFYTIKHTDGNITPILADLVACNPHALHSLDPQGGVEIAEVKRLYGHRVALCGNVACNALDTGTDEQVVESTRYALRHGMPGYGYIFCTSNCIYTGMPLRRYETMLDVWRREGNYEASGD
jgi:uroporphyrinogen decarboxylase